MLSAGERLGKLGMVTMSVDDMLSATAAATDRCGKLPTAIDMPPCTRLD